MSSNKTFNRNFFRLLLPVVATFCIPQARAEVSASTIAFNFLAAKDAAKRSQNILLVHGLVSSKETWLSVEASLSAFGNVWSIDLPGYGDSYRLSSESWDQVKENLTQFIKTNNLQHS